MTERPYLWELGQTKRGKFLCNFFSLNLSVQAEMAGQLKIYLLKKFPLKFGGYKNEEGI